MKNSYRVIAELFRKHRYPFCYVSDTNSQPQNELMALPVAITDIFGDDENGLTGVSDVNGYSWKYASPANQWEITQDNLPNSDCHVMICTFKGNAKKYYHAQWQAEREVFVFGQGLDENNFIKPSDVLEYRILTKAEVSCL